MSVHEQATHAPGVRSEEDRISSGKVVAVGIASLVLFIITSLIVSVYFEKRLASAQLPPAPPDMGSSKIGMVEQQFYGIAQRGMQDRAARLERLGSYGWVDRAAGVAHIPIDRAMELVEKGVRARPGQGQEQRNIGGQP